MKRRLVVIATETDARTWDVSFEYGDPKDIAKFLRAFTRNRKKEGTAVSVLVDQIWEEMESTRSPTDILALKAFDLAWDIGESAEGGGVRMALSQLCAALYKAAAANVPK